MQTMRMVALGERPAELVLKNVRYLNVFTKELLCGDIAIQNGVVAGIGTYDGTSSLDLKRRVVVPGFIDAHLHIESSMVTPVQFCHEVLPWGTTTLIADPHEVANVGGLQAIRFFLSQAAQAICNIRYMLPSCVPATKLDDNGATISAADLLSLSGHEHVLGLGEVMDYRGVLDGDVDVYQKLEAFQSRPIDGHAPMLSGRELQAYRLSGIVTDHETSTEDEVLDRLRCGMFIHIREGSAAKNLETIVAAILKHRLPFDRFGFCTDDKHVSDIRREGHISYHIKKAIQMGIPPEEAYCMASRYPAGCYGLSRLGAIAPGCQADLVVLDDYEAVQIHSVYRKGKLYTPPGRTENRLSMDIGPFRSVNPGVLTPARLKLTADHTPQPVIRVVPGQLVTKCEQAVLPQKNGEFTPNDQYQKIAVLERHRATGRTGVCAITGFSVRGAIGSTVAHDSHNLIVIGDNDADMLRAAEELVRVQGGYTLVRDGRVLATLELPIYGLITGAPPCEAQDKVDEMLEIARSMGIPSAFDPFATMSFLSLPVIPEIKLTSRGVVFP